MTLQQLRYVVMIARTGSINEAAKQLFVAQPSLSSAVKELERELQLTLFSRTNRGVLPTAEGEEFLSYARQVLDQLDLLEDRYLDNGMRKKKFAVSTQHYSFAVKAFVELMKACDLNEYEFAIRETQTWSIIEDVENGRSELGILYLNDFNEKVLQKLFHAHQLEFTELFPSHGYVYLWSGHPLAKREKISMAELEEYPCLSFEQGENNSFYFAEEILSTYDYKKTIQACDRATMLNLMQGVLGYTLCSGIISEELNGNDSVRIPLDLEVDEVMHIGYLVRKNAAISPLGRRYLEELKRFDCTEGAV